MRRFASLRERCCSYAALPSVSGSSVRVASVAQYQAGERSTAGFQLRPPKVPATIVAGDFAHQANGCPERTDLLQQGNAAIGSRLCAEFCAQGGDASRNRPTLLPARVPPDRSLRWSLRIGVQTERSGWTFRSIYAELWSGCLSRQPIEFRLSMRGRLLSAPSIQRAAETPALRTKCRDRAWVKSDCRSCHRISDHHRFEQRDQRAHRRNAAQ